MLVIVGLIVLLVAAIAIAGVPSNAGAAHPLTDFRVRLSPHGVDRHVVPLSDHGRRGGSLGLGLLRRARGPPRVALPTPGARPPAFTVKWRSSTEPATPDSNTKSEPTAHGRSGAPDEGITATRSY